MIKQGTFRGPSVPTRMYARPQLAAPRKILLPNIEEILSALRPKQVVRTPPLGLECKDEKKKVKDADKDYEMVLYDPQEVKDRGDAVKKLLIPMIPSARKPGGLQVRLRLANSGILSYNSAAVKYKQFLNGGVQQFFGGVSSAAEFSSLDVLFDEVFIHSMHYVVKARNKYSGVYPAQGTATDYGAGMAVMYFLPNGAGDYTDNSGLVQNAACSRQHKIVNLGEDWTFTAKNPTKFDPAGPIGDQSSTNSAMGWCLFSLVNSKYGGFCAIGTPVQTGASLQIGTLLESQPVADYMLYYDISVRARA